MAEFQEVIKQGLRMCNFYIDNDENCKNCPIALYIDENDLINVPCGALHREKPEEYEAIVMKWAKAHPEPVYPTWGEWQNENFPGSRFPLSMCHFMNHACPEAESCTTCREQPIPADIAEKLGIKPKEV